MSAFTGPAETAAAWYTSPSSIMVGRILFYLKNDITVTAQSKGMTLALPVTGSGSTTSNSTSEIRLEAQEEARKHGLDEL
jgi:hypothetical protein